MSDDEPIEPDPGTEYMHPSPAALAQQEAPPPATAKGPPKRKKNKELRGREYLTHTEVAALAKAAGRVGRHRHRDATLVWATFYHGFRVSEVIGLRRDQVNLERGEMSVERCKGSRPANHPIPGSELRALRKVMRDYPESPYVFASEREGPLSDSAVRKMIARAGELARLPFTVHPHMLRHGCGHKLANDGVDTRAIQAYLGHSNIQNTVRYTELVAGRFKGFFKD